MTVEQMYGQCTPEGCNSALSNLGQLDDKITIGELRRFLTERRDAGRKEFEKARNELINEAKGKCLRIAFNPDHVVILLIHDVKPFEKYGFIDAELVGETIKQYKGEFSYENNISNTYENYFPNESTEEIELSKFQLLKETITGLKI